jgi:hypothetical protein
MTPAALSALVAKALNRKPTQLELDTWGDVLSCPGQPCSPTDCPHDAEAEKALRTHVAASTYPPTAADVRRLAVGLANQRVEALLKAERDAAITNAVPPTPVYWEATEKLRQAAARRARDLEPAPDNDLAARASVIAAARAAIDAQRTMDPEHPSREHQAHNERPIKSGVAHAGGASDRVHMDPSRATEPTAGHVTAEPQDHR